MRAHSLFTHHRHGISEGTRKGSRKCSSSSFTIHTPSRDNSMEVFLGDIYINDTTRQLVIGLEEFFYLELDFSAAHFRRRSTVPAPERKFSLPGFLFHFFFQQNFRGIARFTELDSFSRVSQHFWCSTYCGYFGNRSATHATVLR